MRQLMDLKVDFAFKQIFGKEGNEQILIAFLNAVLNPPEDQRIVAVEILSPEITREYPDDKASLLDIYAKTEKNVRVNIEIQLANKYDMEKRTLYYWSKIYSAQIKKGKTYADLSKTITINILNYPFLKETERFHTSFHLYEDEEKFPLTDCLEIHFMELPKLMKKWEYHEVSPQEDELVRWLLLLEADGHEEIRNTLEVIALKDPVMKQAFDLWEEISSDEKKWIEYESRKKAILDEFALVREAEIREQKAREEGRLEGEERGIQKGIEQGRMEERNELAKKLLDMKMELVKIVELTGLPLGEIEKLKKEMH